MNTFNKKSLCAAVAGLSVMGIAGTANAVHVNPDGLGQALIYPYYTVRSQGSNPYTSLLSVVNSSASARAVKVRFLEGKNSREVLDFNLYLSKNDVWVAGIVATASGAGVYTPDKSCTVPTVSSDPANPTPFVNFAYSSDAAGGSLDRTREGYVEIIEMGAILGGSTTETAVTHVSGVPPCTLAAGDITGVTTAGNIVNSTSALFGGISLINVNSGTDYTADAVALEAWRTAGANAYGAPGTTTPDLTLANPPTAEVYANGAAITYTFTTGIDAVSGALMHNQLMNEYVLDANTKSATDWVVTFPTKRFYVTSTTATPPFQRNFVATGSCDDVNLSIWDREERTVPTITSFSPPGPTPGTSLCWEANVIAFNATTSGVSNILGSTNTAGITTANSNGWLKIDMTTDSTGAAVVAHTLTAAAATGGPLNFRGMPSIGFALQSFTNSTLTDALGVKVLSNYGGNFIHKTTRLVN